MKCTMTQSEMEPSIIKKGRYTYVHDVKKGPPESIDVHHIIVARSGAWGLMFCTYALLFAIICFLILQLWQNMTSVCQLLTPDKPVAIVLWSFTIAGILLRQLLRKQVEKVGEQFATLFQLAKS